MALTRQSRTVLQSPTQAHARGNSAAGEAGSALQQLADDSAQVAQLRAIQTLARTATIQREETGSTGDSAASVPQRAKDAAARAAKPEYQKGGSAHIKKVKSGHGGYEHDGQKYVGGSTFKNKEGKLPTGASYTEWDVNPVAGQRDAERVVVSSDGKYYYTGDHYASFTEFTP